MTHSEIDKKILHAVARHDAILKSIAKKRPNLQGVLNALQNEAVASRRIITTADITRSKVVTPACHQKVPDDSRYDTFMKKAAGDTKERDLLRNGKHFLSILM